MNQREVGGRGECGQNSLYTIFKKTNYSFLKKEKNNPYRKRAFKKLITIFLKRKIILLERGWEMKVLLMIFF